MTMTSQMALLQNIQTMTLLNTFNTTVSHSEQSLFLSDAEINSFMLLDLDVDSMNEPLELETLEELSSKKLAKIAA